MIGVNSYRPDIDGLRALAVLVVIFFHAFPHLFPGGFIGVDVFFVISGYLITTIILGDIKCQRFSLIRFYQKRIKRIFPALLIFLAACMGAGFYLLFDTEYAHLAKHIYSSALFINNFVLIHEAGYFDKISDLKPLLHLWSLGIEEQFYLIWPVLIWLLSKSKKTLLGVMLGFILISFTINLLRVKHHAVDAFFSPQSRIWELALGGLLAYFPPTQRFEKLPLHHFGLVLFLVLVFRLSQSLLYPSWYACLPCLAAISLLCFPPKFLAHPKMVVIGRISYPLYLWHWGLLSFARIIYGGQISGPLTLSLLLLSFILSGLTYRFVEYPIRNQLHPKYDKLLMVGLVLGLAALGFFGFKIYEAQGLPKRAIHQNDTYKNDLRDFDSYHALVSPCDELAHDPDNHCWRQKKASPHGIIWGDSHAEHLFSGLIQEDKKSNWMLLERSACPPFLGVRAYWQGNKDQCDATNRKILQTISQQSSVKEVILGFVGLFYLSDAKAAYSWRGEIAPKNFHLELAHHPELSKKEVFIQGLENTINALEQAGKKVILMEDIPLLPFMPEACISRPLRYQPLPCDLPKSFVWQSQQDYHDILMRLQARHPQLKIFSGMDAICQKKTCAVIQNSHLVYRDSQHLSLAGSRILARALIKDLA